ncbi:GNAT family N-acetyltransferase [Tengunoibacter tsumagoiensis]|uniref:N-acetyltransferase domain-containing protein n=1 Tax=Tengunoibacter tsumagoiensis TaxID=2014871 RepID=A0A402A512_9CHLR|nr:GNAT family N-acetyltransferase [Tengunoibacter tsumagoiensis]GCE14149.1 hypothetical protein KTT_40080 [Tengunoibacter tsumagoiensis]
MSITLRQLSDVDLSIAEAIMQAAYGYSTPQQRNLARYLSLQPDGWLLACLDQRPVGVGGVINYGSFAYLGSMSVLPTVQRQGIGRALLQAFLNWLDEWGCPTVLLDASSAGADLYKKFAFVPEGEVAQWRRQADLSTVELETFSPGITSFQLKDLPAVTAFDAAYFGAGRAAVLAAYLREYPERALIHRTPEGKISGYLIAQKSIIGPWLAENPEDAERLLQSALAFPYTQAPMISAPTENKAATSLLTCYGFQIERTLLHMRRGEPAILRDRSSMYGQTNYTLG